LLRAAVRVFAGKGFSAARVGDIAAEAGVAHGLLYHYFASKDDVLDEIFRRTWSNLGAELEQIEAAGPPVAGQLRRFARVYLGSWLETPDLIRVLVREVARSADVAARVGELEAVFAPLERILAAAKAHGEVRADVDVRFAAFAVYGALEEILTGFVLGRLPDGRADVDAAVATVADVVSAGLVP
jgi:TetR/AcrR family transcriptional regulator, fatty acid metabolism regulator protein